MGNSGSTLEKCLVAALAGNSALVATPRKPFYQISDVHPYNLDLAITPAAITYPRNAQEVAAVVKCAGEANLKVQPRGGGHSYGNYGLGGKDGAVVVDLKDMQSFSMDTTTWQATIGPGYKLGALDEKLDAAGKRLIAHGTCPDVGLSGHATIGGLGPASRTWGATLDHIEDVEVVLANATITRASARQNPDLFFALKGAGASFGIITEFKMRTNPQPIETVSYRFALTERSVPKIADAFKRWQDFVADPNLSRKLASTVTLLELGMVVSGTFFGPKAEFDALNITGVFPSDFDGSTVVFRDWLGQATQWVQDIALGLGSGLPSPFYSKSLGIPAGSPIPPDGIDRIIEYVYNTPRGTLLWFVIFDLAAGAISDVPAGETAYAHRNALFWLQSYGVGVPNVAQETKDFLEGVNQVVEDALPGKALGAYPGYVDPLLANAQEAYWAENLPRLEQIKKAVDPKDLFSNPQSVRPAA